MNVSNRIRPSEREAELENQKREHFLIVQKHDDKIKALETKKLAIEEELGSLGFRVEPGEEGWVSLYDESSGYYYMQNPSTGEVKWASE